MGKNPTKSFPHSQVARFTCIVYLVPREDEDHIVHITDKIQRNENKTGGLAFVVCTLEKIVITINAFRCCSCLRVYFSFC